MESAPGADPLSPRYRPVVKRRAFANSLGRFPRGSGILSYLPAGRLCQPPRDPGTPSCMTALLPIWLAALAGTTVLLLGGLAQLAILTGSLSQALPLAVHPFVLLDAVKALVAALLVPKSTLRAPV